MTYFLLLGTNQFAVVADNGVQCHDNRKDNILTFIAIKTCPERKLFYNFWEADGGYTITNKYQKISGRIFFPCTSGFLFVIQSLF